MQYTENDAGSSQSGIDQVSKEVVALLEQVLEMKTLQMILMPPPKKMAMCSDEDYSVPITPKVSSLKVDLKLLRQRGRFQNDPRLLIFSHI